MDKLEYFLLAGKFFMHTNNAWVLSTFGILDIRENLNRVDSGDTINATDKRLSSIGLRYVNKSLQSILGDDVKTINGFKEMQPLFGINERVTVKASSLKCLKVDVDTTYGILLMNCILLEYPYGDKADYINGVMDDKVLNTLGEKLLKRDDVTVAQHFMFENAISAITNFTQIAVPSASKKAITVNPLVAKRKAELLLQYKDKLNDPATITIIQDELVKLDKEYLKGDPSLGFFIKKKSWNMTRLRTYSMYGAEPDFSDESKISVMTASLSEGWQAKDMVLIANATRGGSYARGASTALGGAEVKITSRIFNTFTIDDNNCNTTKGVECYINKNNYTSFIGRTKLNGSKPLTKDDLSALIGKMIYLYSPAYCSTPSTVICRRCIGENVYNSGVGIGALATTTTSTFLAVFMALVHTTSLSVAEYDLNERLT